MPFDRADLAEVLGNLLENAARHARSRVSITASAEPVAPLIVIDDDGPGIAETARSRVIERGVRLDERDEGAGLGLAIVQDVLDAYGWHFELAASERLGGLRVTIAPGSLRKLDRPDRAS
jgi:signal transduction histidine kinase